jgi:hypothetical protein
MPRGSLVSNSKIPLHVSGLSCRGLVLASTTTRRAIKTGVRYLATSTSFHSGVSESEDVYLVQINLLGSGGEVASARLVDEYPPYRAAIPSAILESAAGGKLMLRRDRGCDITFGWMPMRTAPGDPTAVIAEPLEDSPPVPRQVSDNELLPYYRTVRSAN